MISYPADLPAPLFGYSQEPENAILRTSMQSGRARQRRLYTSMPSYTTFEWIFAGECDGIDASGQARLFETWARSLTGAQWFDIPVRTPWGRDILTLRFRSTPQGPSMEGPNAWRYTAAVEIREPQRLPGEWAEIAPEFILYADIFDRAINLEWPQWAFSTYSDIFDTAINQEWPAP